LAKKRLTNVAVIKYRVSKKNFEIACYKNKAINWRNGIETDLNEVLQTNAIYRNADQGEQASQEELEKYFPDMSFDDIIKTILDKGELDIGDKERDQQKDILFKDIANLIAEKCVHPETKRPFSIESIKAALNSIHFAPKLDQPAKKQASDCLKKLIDKYYIARAEMKIKLTIPSTIKDKVFTELENNQVKPESVIDEKENISLVCLIEPSLYRILDDLVKKKLGEGTMEIITHCVMNREITDVEHAEVATLKLREKPLSEETKEENEPEGNTDKKNKKNKKGSAKPKKKEDSSEDDKKHKIQESSKEPEDKKVSKTNEVKEGKNVTDEKVSEKKFKCTSCKNAFFDNNAEFRTHFKTDWHNFNLRRKIDKKEPVTEDEYLDQLLDSEVTGKK
jgi:ribosome maturation protein SDO1